ncbi:MAG: 4Fe-4S dicluster domain-containing protein [Magnetococcales bacterium]|nr:4Fe-4S dicluster domain-containing protein [Magnetococcales bacterium]
MAETTPTKPARKKISRRSFHRGVLLTLATLSAAGAGYFPLSARPKPFLRPPGAVPEAEFLASCIKCGQCVQTCPVEAIELAFLEDGFGVGTAYIDARKQGCDFSCDALQCILACPTGALDHRIEKPDQVTMGLAELTHPAQCLATQNRGFSGHPRGADYEGLLRYSEIDRWKPQRLRDHPVDREICDLCVEFCPIDGAITLEKKSQPNGETFWVPEVHSNCTGCGVCEMVCPVPEAAIEIIPWKKATDGVTNEGVKEPAHVG